MSQLNQVKLTELQF